MQLGMANDINVLWRLEVVQINDEAVYSIHQCIQLTSGELRSYHSGFLLGKDI